jgi:2,3-bisphosphoglycerate-dependent phosphoglycerate mutase
MKLLIIRHGQSEGDILKRIEGRAEFNLTDLGLKQAQLMAEWVSEKYKIDKILSSPLKRARQTATALSERVKVKIMYDDDLMEWNIGSVAGLLIKDAVEKYPNFGYFDTQRQPHTVIYEQESFIQLRMRAETVLSKILNENPTDSTVAIFSHGLLIGNLFNSFLRLPVTSNNIWFSTGDTGVHEWRVDGDKRNIIHVNLQYHLEGLHTE